MTEFLLLIASGTSHDPYRRISSMWMTPMELSTRAFEIRDQHEFAAASGDYNPIHIDPLAARRTQGGSIVVHGVHLLLWALNEIGKVNGDFPELGSMNVRFTGFVHVGERVSLDVVEFGPDRTQLSLNVAGRIVVQIAIAFGRAASAASDDVDAHHESESPPASPLSLTLDQMEGRSGRIQFPTPLILANLFPVLRARIGIGRLVALASSTALIGMICPGLHSIYAGLTLASSIEDDSETGLAYRVKRVDPRFRMVWIAVKGGGWIGTLQAFLRVPPVEQASMKSLSQLVQASEFAGSVALIIGGSRGLGELTAKVLAAGGAKLIITYRTGESDAKRVADEIALAGGRSSIMCYDSWQPAAPQLSCVDEIPTHLYYYATPPIFRPQAGLLDPERFAEFLSVYVDGFWSAIEVLRGRRPNLSAYYPSSAAVADRPPGMTAYAMAKAAGETLCSDINQCLLPTHVTVSRLPRLPTDQTASVTSVATASAVDEMLPIIREVQSWPRSTEQGKGQMK